MKNQQEKYAKRVDRIVRRIIELFRNYELQQETKLVAFCEYQFSEDKELEELFEDMKTIKMGANFDKMTTYDKLLAIKATINAHLQFTHGEISPFGKILNYELVEGNSQTYRAFDVHGNFISSF